MAFTVFLYPTQEQKCEYFSSMCHTPGKLIHHRSISLSFPHVTLITFTVLLQHASCDNDCMVVIETSWHPTITGIGILVKIVSMTLPGQATLDKVHDGSLCFHFSLVVSFYQTARRVRWRSMMTTSAGSAWMLWLTAFSLSVGTWSPAPSVAREWTSVRSAGSTSWGPCMSLSHNVSLQCCGSSEQDWTQNWPRST